MLHEPSDQGKPGDTPTAEQREQHAQRLLIEQLRTELKSTRQIVGKLLVSHDELRAADGMKARVIAHLLQRQNQSEIHIDELQRIVRDADPRLTAVEGDIDHLFGFLETERRSKGGK